MKLATLGPDDPAIRIAVPVARDHRFILPALAKLSVYSRIGPSTSMSMPEPVTLIAAASIVTPVSPVRYSQLKLETKLTLPPAVTLAALGAPLP